ncbi:MAG: tRNA lysidine(34) synthetase TilS, partial [Acidobacteriota bacterium]
ISDLENLLPIVRKQLVRHVLRDISGTLRGVNQGHIDSVLELMTGQSGRSVTLPGGMVITREFDALRFSLNPLPIEFLYQVEVPADIQISEVGKRIVFAEASVGSKGVTIPGERVIVRNRRPGDRFRAGPKARTKTLKKLFLEKKVPKHRRDRLIVIECQGEIVWLEGFPSADPLNEHFPQAKRYDIHLVNETFRS